MTNCGTAARIVVGITGASGAIYARRLVQCLCDASAEVHLIVSANGRRLLGEELAVTDVSPLSFLGHESNRLLIHPCDDVGAHPASGSFKTNGMIVCPCTGNTLGALAGGLADNLLTRAAAVTLKESRRLILVPREMPLSRIDLLNALRLSEAGAIICPASPGFYMHPESIADLADFVAGKLLDLIDIPHELNTRWADRLDAHRQAGFDR